MGRMCAIFKADSDESAGRYSVSEWRLEPRTRGAEVHPEDHVFFVIAGTLSLRVNDDWTHVTKGTYVIIPGGTLTPLRIKDRSTQVLYPSIRRNSPGGFEAKMTSIAAALATADLRM